MVLEVYDIQEQRQRGVEGSIEELIRRYHTWILKVRLLEVYSREEAQYTVEQCKLWQPSSELNKDELILIDRSRGSVRLSHLAGYQWRRGTEHV